MSTPTVRQLKIAAAFADARRLIDELGQEHPKAMMAMITAVDLADPEFMDGQLQAAGIALPAPSHFTAEGEPLYSSDDVARTLDLPLDEFTSHIEAVFAAAEISPLAPTHRVQ